jgi:hypothetical protein
MISQKLGLIIILSELNLKLKEPYVSIKRIEEKFKNGDLIPYLSKNAFDLKFKMGY